MSDFERAARYADEADSAVVRARYYMERGELVSAYRCFLAAAYYAAHELAALRGES